jgi:hypothetical protein
MPFASRSMPAWRTCRAPSAACRHPREPDRPRGNRLPGGV